MSSPIDLLKENLYEQSALRAAIAILDWDQQCFMPVGGSEARSQHVGILSRLAHEKMTSEESQKLLEAAAGIASTDEEKALVRVVRRQVNLATKLPSSFVEKKAKLTSFAHEKWVQARANNDFASFASTLETNFDLTREEAEYLGYKEHPYDALLDQYEEGATTADIYAMFDAIRAPQVELVRQISERPAVDVSFLVGNWDINAQKKFTETISKAIGFDFNRGRQDVAAHPFCTGWSVNDVRLTTRFGKVLTDSIFGTLHESGHGMYEQGSPEKWDQTPLAGGVSMGLHESQSRLWENIVGRSLEFWTHFYPTLQESFPELTSVSLESFYKAVNRVKPDFIRVESDELTYNLHILVRFELEVDLITGTLPVKSLPEAWNEKYRSYLGIVPPTDTLGCLQDVHWSAALIGYFPTYSMGNLLSYQIWNRLTQDIANPDTLIASGNFQPILSWLQAHIYSMGKKLEPSELVRQVTGKPIDASDYLAGLTAKYKALYDL